MSAAKGLPRYESLQPWYNLYNRAQFEEGLGGAVPARERRRHQLLLARERVSHWQVSVARRILAGSARGYRVKDMMNERGMRILAALDAVAAS